MKTCFSVFFVLFFGFFVSFSVVAQETGTTDSPKAAALSVEPTKQESPSSKKGTQQFVVRVKTKKKVDFSGTVTHVDPETATLSIRNKGKTISFDMSKPVLIGYQSPGEIKKGDAISVGYTQFGLQIRKGTFTATHQEPAQEAEKTAAPKNNRAKNDTAKLRKNGPVRMREIKNPASFQDVDNDKDGKITPIELCVMTPGLTMQKFKEYDKNSDGCLNEAEFAAFKRNNNR